MLSRRASPLDGACPAPRPPPVFWNDSRESRRASMARTRRRARRATSGATTRRRASTARPGGARRANAPRRTGVDEREGWEDFTQKREWFLSGRAIADGRSRTLARLEAIGQADVVGQAALESLDPGGAPLRRGARLVGTARRAAPPRTVSRRLPGAPGLARPVEVAVSPRDVDATLQVALSAAALGRVDPASVRMFRFESATRTWQLVPRSGYSPSGGYAWVRVHRPGVYVPIGLPLDRAGLAALVRTFNARATLRDAAERSRAAASRAVAAVLGRGATASRGAPAGAIAARLRQRMDLPEWDLLAE